MMSSLFPVYHRISEREIEHRSRIVCDRIALELRPRKTVGDFILVSIMNPVQIASLRRITSITRVRIE